MTICEHGIDCHVVHVTRDYDAMNTDIVVATELWHDEDERCFAGPRKSKENMSTVDWARKQIFKVTGFAGDEETYSMVIDALAAEIDVLSWLLAEAQWEKSQHCPDCSALPCVCS